MSSADINPLAIVNPYLYAQQLAIQRRQALAQGLLENGSDPGKGAYGGLRSAGNQILGAFLARGADKDLANLYAPQPDPSQQPQQPADIGQVSNTPVQPTTPLQTDGGGVQQPAPSQPMPAPQQQPQAMVQPARSIPGAMAGAIPDLPGMTHQQSMLEYYQDNADYWKAIAPTPEYRNALMAAGGDPQKAQQFLSGEATKAGTTTVTRGMAIGPDGRITYAPPPAPAGYQYVTGQNGQPMLIPTEGGVQAVAGSALANRVPTALTTPGIGYGPDSQPQATNALALSGNANLAPQMGIGAQPQSRPNITANNPLNMQPGGQEQRYATPTAGFGTAWDNLSSYAKQGVNTVNAIVKRWAPNAPPQYAANVAQTLGVHGDQPLNLSDPNVKGLLIDAMRPNETGSKYSQPPGGALLPELPQGQPQYMQAQGKDAADRHDATLAAAQESPMRINVLDNIINLSKQGVATGPGQEWQNELAGLISNSPVLSKAIPASAKDNLAKFQELQKFTYQNAIRSWQAAGGTGTDNQMQAMSHANPNDTLFPQALQGIAQWGKAAELAVQGKANAQDRFLAQNGQTPANQIKFENVWRNSFDPKAFQYAQIQDPKERAAFVAQNIRTPQEAQMLKAKISQLQQLGALQ